MMNAVNTGENKPVCYVQSVRSVVDEVVDSDTHEGEPVDVLIGTLRHIFVKVCQVLWLPIL